MERYHPDKDNDSIFSCSSCDFKTVNQDLYRAHKFHKCFSTTIPPEVRQNWSLEEYQAIVKGNGSENDRPTSSSSNSNSLMDEDCEDSLRVAKVFTATDFESPKSKSVLQEQQIDPTSIVNSKKDGSLRKKKSKGTLKKTLSSSETSLNSSQPFNDANREAQKVILLMNNSHVERDPFASEHILQFLPSSGSYLASKLEPLNEISANP